MNCQGSTLREKFGYTASVRVHLLTVGSEAYHSACVKYVHKAPTQTFLTTCLLSMFVCDENQMRMRKKTKMKTAGKKMKTTMTRAKAMTATRSETSAL